MFAQKIITCPLRTLRPNSICDKRKIFRSMNLVKDVCSKYYQNVLKKKKGQCVHFWRHDDITIAGFAFIRC